MIGLGHFWSLAVEEQFYLVWPLIVFFVRRRRPLLWICVAAWIGCPILRLTMFHAGIPDAYTHACTLARADSLLTGAALALLLRGPKHERVLRHAPAALALMLPAGCVLLLLADRFARGHASAVVPFGLQYTALALAAAALICCSLRPGAVATVFHWSVLRWVGKYSYGIYVYHLIVFTALEYPLRKWLAAHVSQNKGLLVLGVGGLSLLFAVLLAYTSYQMFERHFLRLKRFFDYRPHPDTVVPAASESAAL